MRRMISSVGAAAALCVLCLNSAWLVCADDDFSLPDMFGGWGGYGQPRGGWGYQPSPYTGIQWRNAYSTNNNYNQRPPQAAAYPGYQVNPYGVGSWWNGGFNAHRLQGRGGGDSSAEDSGRRGTAAGGSAPRAGWTPGLRLPSNVGDDRHDDSSEEKGDGDMSKEGLPVMHQLLGVGPVQARDGDSSEESAGPVLHNLWNLPGHLVGAGTRASSSREGKLLGTGTLETSSKEGKLLGIGSLGASSKGGSVLEINHETLDDLPEALDIPEAPEFPEFDVGDGLELDDDHLLLLGLGLGMGGGGRGTGRPGCQLVADVVVMVDCGSVGPGEVGAMQRSLEALVDLLQPSSTGRHLALLAYRDTIILETALSGDPMLLKRQIQTLSVHTGRPNSVLALQRMIALTGSQGRAGVPKACVLLTGDNSGNLAAARGQAMAARGLGIRLVVVGIGAAMAVREELRELAGNPGLVLSAPRCADLPRLAVVMAFIAVCPAIPTNPLATTSRKHDTTTPGITTVKVTRPTVTTFPPTTPVVTTPTVTTARATTPPLPTTTRQTTPAPTTPRVTTPASSTPKATTPGPTTPRATAPTPTTPKVTTPAPTTSKATTPTPTTPKATTSTPSTLRATTPTPATPKATTPAQTTPRATTLTPTTPRATTPTPTTPKATTPAATTPKVTKPAPTTPPTPQPSTTPVVTTPQPSTTPVVTTPQPSTTPKPPLPEICENCTMVNGVGYKAHWSRCDLFLQCQFLPDGSVTVTVKQCPHGLHWSQDALTCTAPHQARCHHDPCQASETQRHAATGNCRGFWQCAGGRSEGLCCPEGYGFQLGTGCVPDPDCREPCGVAPVVPAVCDKRAVMNMPLTFEQYVPGAGWRLMYCAPGTAFNLSQCACADFRRDQVNNVCRPELYLPFNGPDVRDESGNNNYVQNEGVKVVNGAGYFDGNALLRVPRFSNSDFGDFVLVRLRYKQDPSSEGSPNEQALVANGDCLKPSSLYIAAGQQGVKFGAQTTSGTNATVIVPGVATGGWQEAVLFVDRHTLTGSLNNFSLQTLFTGSLATSKCALQIGRGTNFSHFRGYMDDITVYLCRPTTF